MDADPAAGADPVTAAALRARDGDEGAAVEFVRATQADVWRMCRHLSDFGQAPMSARARSDAEDLTQETYARAFASLHRFAGRSSARTWLLSIARRVCADAVRVAVRERAHRPVIAGGPVPDEPDPAEAVTVRALLAILTTERREAFVLTQMLGLSYAEAADVCACPVGTIRSRVARARTDLVEGLDDRRTRAAGV